MGNLKLFQSRYSALRKQMFADGVANGLPLELKDLKKLTERLESEGTSFVKVTLPSLGKALDLGLVTGQFNCPSNFKLKKGTRLPTFMFSLFSEIFEDGGSLREHVNVAAMRFLRQFLLLDSKLIFEPNPVMKDNAVKQFEERMNQLRKKKVPVNHPVLIRAQALLGKVLKHLDLSDIRPGHGPGAVAERLDKFGRWDFTSWPAKAETHYPYCAFGIHSLQALLERGKVIPLVKTSVTRCALVPKDFKGPRLISVEGVVNQYLQQGQMKSMMEYVEQHWLLKRSIRLQDQSFNQRAAQVACARGSVTLDLSNASDTVSVPLVWFLLAEVPKLRRQLMSTRSDYMEYSGRRIRITSFAPMGSATCFPVETLVFWALAFASIQLTSLHGRTGNSTLSLREVSDELAVFGDDIIVPDRAFSTLAATLDAVGCSVNMSKTCVETPFRESCGSEWYNNEDVTIIRNKRVDYQTFNVSTHPDLCDLQRKLFLHGYYRSAILLTEWVREIYPTPVFAVSRHYSDAMLADSWAFRRFNNQMLVGKVYYAFLHEQMDYVERSEMAFGKFGGLLGFTDDFSTVNTRWSLNYQRFEYRTPMVHQRTRSWTTGGYPRLLARLLGDQIERTVIRDRKVKMTWVNFVFSDFPLRKFYKT